MGENQSRGIPAGGFPQLGPLEQEQCLLHFQLPTSDPYDRVTRRRGVGLGASVVTYDYYPSSWEVEAGEF